MACIALCCCRQPEEAVHTEAKWQSFAAFARQHRQVSRLIFIVAFTTMPLMLIIGRLCKFWAVRPTLVWLFVWSKETLICMWSVQQMSLPPSHLVLYYYSQWLHFFFGAGWRDCRGDEAVKLVFTVVGNVAPGSHWWWLPGRPANECCIQLDRPAQVN